ncbi:MAG: ATP-binding domain-containing protein, partial [Alphaproteobacteria bacterium]|nr:ATP-binding domain-containing protein [Alphaproteobacteria bacterium]
PRRGVGKVALQIIEKTSSLHNKSLLEGLKIALDFGEIRGKTGDILKEFSEDISKWQKDLKHLSAPEMGEKILKESGYLKYWEESKEPDAEMRLEHLQDFLNTLKKFATLEDFLEHIALISATDSKNEDDQVSLMTMHASKGLEFDLVFLPAWEERVFPNDKAIEANALEEERRLAYVGLTRAKKDVLISYCASRFLFGSRQNNFPSCFIREMPTETTRIIEHAYTPKEKISKQERAKKITQTVNSSQDLNSLLVGRSVRHKEFGKGEILEANATEFKVLFKGGEVKKVHARKVEFI